MNLANSTDHATDWDDLAILIIAAFVIAMLWILTRD